MVDIGISGRHCEGGVFSNSRIGQKFTDGTIGISTPANLSGSNIIMPYYFAADDAFPLQVRIIKLYPGRQLEKSLQIFNYRLCRGRRVVENAFGILCVHWQIFL